MQQRDILLSLRTIWCDRARRYRPVRKDGWEIAKFARQMRWACGQCGSETHLVRPKRSVRGANRRREAAQTTAIRSIRLVQLGRVTVAAPR